MFDKIGFEDDAHQAKALRVSVVSDIGNDLYYYLLGEIVDSPWR